jgi:predicted HNH restriction endonuclease
MFKGWIINYGGIIMEIRDGGVSRITKPVEKMNEEDIRSLVKSFEQNDAARKACIEYHGNSCSVCGFRYDNIFNEEYLQTHFVAPLQNVLKSRTLDPISDLRPICAYCHEKIHSYEPNLSIEELKVLMSNCAS